MRIEYRTTAVPGLTTVPLTNVSIQVKSKAREHSGLLYPEAIVGIRKRCNLSQKKLEILFSLGEKVVIRWEKGRVLQGKLNHYDLHSTRINRDQSHENGVAEQGHYRLEDAVDQVLILRGSRDLDTGWIKALN